MELLTFRAARSLLGVPVDDVQEIIDGWSFTPLPLLPDGFTGVAEVHGAAVPVADLTRLTGGLPEGRRRTMVVLRSSIALLVDAVETVINVETLEPPGNGPRWVVGTAGEVQVVDGRRLTE